MKTREETARFVESQFIGRSGTKTKREKGYQSHYGKQELRDLLDFIYGGAPTTKTDELFAKDVLK